MNRSVTPLYLVACSLMLGAGCQHAPAAHDTHATHDAHSAHVAHDAHAASQPQDAHAAHAGHGNGHDLKPLMRQMLVHVVALQDALTTSHAADAATHATALAEACQGGEEHAHHDLPKEWGPEFVNIDRALHQGAEKMQHVLHEGDLAQATAMYAGVLAQCQACHAQAPIAAGVRLGRLLDAPK